MTSAPLFYVVDWLPPEFGAVGQYAMAFSRGAATSGRRVCLIGLTSGPGSTTRESFSGGGALEIRRINATLYDKSRYVSRIWWTLRTNLRLVYELFRASDPRHTDVLFTGSPPFMLFFCVGAKWMLGVRLIYRTTDFYPEVIIAELGRRYLPLVMFERVTWLFRRLVDEFEVLGEDQRRLLLKEGIRSDRIKLVRDAPPIAISGSEHPAPRPAQLAGRKVLLYSGNYGVAHEADTVVQGLIRHHREGSGGVALWLNASGRKGDEVEQQLRSAGAPIARTSPVALEQLPALLAAADIHLITLRPAFSGIVLPSKVYGCIASRRPILFVGPASSDVHLLCTEANVRNYERVAPGDAAGFAAALERLCSA
jgi:hypothetical protein